MKGKFLYAGELCGICMCSERSFILNCLWFIGLLLAKLFFIVQCFSACINCSYSKLYRVCYGEVPPCMYTCVHYTIHVCTLCTSHSCCTFVLTAKVRPRRSAGGEGVTMYTTTQGDRDWLRCYDETWKLG